MKASNESSPPRKKSIWRRMFATRTSWFLIGAVLASGFWVWRYDPALFRLTPTVVNPRRPPAPVPGTIVVDPLSQTWDFDKDKVSWEPILPLAQISETAYHESYELESTLKTLGLTRVSEFPLNSMYAYVASNEKTVVVAFRGTNQDELQDWLADARIASDPVRHGRIHRGFYRSTQGLLDDILAAVKEHGGDNKRLWITGHSLGGAMALVFTYECIVRSGVKPVGLVTFGQPLVVNGELAQFLNAELKGKYLRFVHGGDIVPRVFPSFSHCGNLVWFINDGYVFRRPEMAARASKADEGTPPLEYSSGPKPLSRTEFESLQERLKRQPRRRQRGRRNSEIQPAEAPAFLEDHYMTGYIHWVLALKDREAAGPQPPVGAGNTR